MASGNAGCWTLRASRPAFTGHVKVRTRTYVMPDGAVSDWDIVEGCRTVAVLALTADHQVILARQFRAGPGRVLLELPGGGMGDGEEPAAAAARELEEETGYRAGRVEIAGSSWLASFATHRQFAALATDCVSAPGGQRLDDLEFIDPVVLGMDDFRDHLRGGDLTDAGSAYMALDFLARNHLVAA